MGSIQLLLGKSRWRRRRALPHAHLSGVDKLGRPTFLYVTGTQRKKRVVEREFLQWRRERPVFSPQVRVLSEVLDELHLRHGRGHALLPERVCALEAERILDDHGVAWPWLGSLGGGPEAGGALARLHRQMAEARVKRLTDVPHAEELNTALTELDRHLSRISGFVTRPRALEALLRILEAPPPALTQWLRATHSVILDDILQLSPLRRQVLVALCQAWEAAGTHVVVAFESGRDLGGREVEAFFEYGDVDEVAFTLKPLAATRDLRKALFEAVVGQGSGGSILLARADAVEEIEPWSQPAPSEPPDLSDLVYGGAPIGVSSPEDARALLQERVRILKCEDPEAELREIASQVKEALLGGEDPGDCVVALPDLATYAPSIRAVFEDHGLPYTLAAGARLAHSPVTNAVRRIAGLALARFPVGLLLPLLGSDLVACPEGCDPRWLRVACRAAGVREGMPLEWEGPLRGWMYRTRNRVELSDLAALRRGLEALQALCAPLVDLAHPATPEAFRDNLLSAAEALGLPGRVGRCEDARTASDNLHAWGRILEVLDDLVRDLLVVDPGPWPARALADNLDRALHEAAYHPETPGLARVQVVGALELRGLTPRRTWLGGLHRTAFPAPRSASFLVPRSVERAMDPVDPLAEARYLFGSLLRNVLDDGQMASLVVSWPATVDGQPQAPSPVLSDLLDRPTLDPDALFGDLVVERPVDTGAVLSRSDALRAVARAADAWVPLLDPEEAHLAAVQAEVHAARGAPTPGEWEGVLTRRFPVAQPLGVTRLETYLRCPARYGYQYVLGLERVREWEPEIDAIRRGSAIHRILDRFLRARGYASLHRIEAREAAAAELHRIATAEMDQVRDQGGAEVAFIEQERRRWLSGLVDEEPAGLLRAWLDAEVDGDLEVQPLATEREVGPFGIGPVAVRGKVDRVDRLADGGILVSDYKTGGTVPGPRAIRRGLALQPVAYAAALTEFYPGEPIGAAYYQVWRPDGIGRRSWCGDRAVLDKAGKGGVPLDSEGRRVLLDHAAEGARRLLSGVFHATLAEPDEVGCEFCDYRRICRRHPDRARALLGTEADLQRPVEVS
jgi:RecB family exonuclease